MEKIVPIGSFVDAHRWDLVIVQGTAALQLRRRTLGADGLVARAGKTIIAGTSCGLRASLSATAFRSVKSKVERMNKQKGWAQKGSFEQTSLFGGSWHEPSPAPCQCNWSRRRLAAHKHCTWTRRVQNSLRYPCRLRYSICDVHRGLQLQVRCVRVGLLEEDEVIGQSKYLAYRTYCKALSSAFSFMPVATGLGIWV